MGSSWALRLRQSRRLRLRSGSRRSQHPSLFILVSSRALCIEVSLYKASPRLLLGVFSLKREERRSRCSLTDPPGCSEPGWGAGMSHGVTPVLPTGRCGALGQQPEPFTASGCPWLGGDPRGGTHLLGEECVDPRSRPCHLLVSSWEKSWLSYELLGFEPDLCPLFPICKIPKEQL